MIEVNRVVCLKPLLGVVSILSVLDHKNVKSTTAPLTTEFGKDAEPDAPEFPVQEAVGDEEVEDQDDKVEELAREVGHGI